MEGAGLGDYKTSTINASLMQIVSTVDYLKVNLPPNKKGGIASVGYCDGTITKLFYIFFRAWAKMPLNKRNAGCLKKSWFSRKSAW